MASEGGPSGGVGFCGLLAILFIGLKLAGKVDWGWAWVLSPVWIPPLVVLAFGLAIVVVAGLARIVRGG